MGDIGGCQYHARHFDHQVLNLVAQIARLIGLGLDEQDLKARLNEEHQRQFF